MKKIMNRVLAATRPLVLTMAFCGATVFTSCSSDKDDNPAQEQAKKNRKEFVEHTRAVMKDLAENLNFGSWNGANILNKYFNEYVLNNPEFVKSHTFMQKMLQSIKPVEEGSELAQMGFTMYATLDPTDSYHFTMNAENTGFDIEEAEDFEILLNAPDVEAGEWAPQATKLSVKAVGNQGFKMVLPSSQKVGLAIVVLMPSEFQFAISFKIDDTWYDGFTGTFNIQPTASAGSEYFQMGRNNWSVNGTVCSKELPIPDAAYQPDAATLTFSIANDRVHNTGNYAFSWEQNGRKMFDLTMKQSRDASGGIANLDLSQFSSSSSIFDVVAAWMATRRLDEAKLTLLDDLTTTLSVSDMQKALQLQNEMASARRNYADRQTIEAYTQQLNGLVKAEMTCKGVNQTIPMKLVTTKFGVDYWTMPAFNFADENGYVSFTDLLDPESVQYGINIIDHAAEPMQQSLIVVRQLLQYVQGLVSGATGV